MYVSSNRPQSTILKSTLVTDHGDHVLITASQEGNGGGMIMLGRSDGVLLVFLNMNGSTTWSNHFIGTREAFALVLQSCMT